MPSINICALCSRRKYMYKNNKDECELKLPIKAKTFNGKPTTIFMGFPDYDCKAYQREE